MKQDVTLALNTPLHLPDRLEITLTSVSIEEIAACPGDEAAYPAGSGANATLRLKRGELTGEITLSLLSAPYESRVTSEWHSYVITLLDIPGAAMDATARIRVESQS